MSVDEYFSTFTSLTTISSYKSILGRYFQQIYGEGNLIEQVEKYVSENRDHQKDITQFFISINHFTPGTVRQYLNVVKNFVEYLRGEEFNRSFTRKLLRRRKGTRPVTADRAPTKEELRSILSHLDLKGKSLVLTMVSSGLRIGEALQIKLADIYLDKNPVEINVRGEYTKTGNRRDTFLSQEAKEFILQWLRVREDYIKSSHKRNFGKPRNIDDPRIFPISSSTAHDIWNLALKKAGLDDRDPVTKYRLLRMHGLRKFFRTQLSKVDGAGEMPEGLLGHIDAYVRYTQEDYREFYLKAEYILTIFGGADLRELSETKDSIVELKDDQLRISTQMLNLLEDNKSLRDVVEKLEKLYEMSIEDRTKLSLQVENIMLEMENLREIIQLNTEPIKLPEVKISEND
jgi:integrase